MVTSSTPYADIMPAGSMQEKGDAARLTSFVGAIAIGDLVKTTLGPKGLDKIITSGKKGDFSITNDGATILGSLPLDNPAAKVLVSLSKGQDDAIGDGTTSVTVLAAELLREAERLVEHGRMHPQLVIQGYRMATKYATDALERFADISPCAFQPASTVGGCAEMNEELLLNLAKTTLSSKVLSAHHEHFAHIAVDVVKRLASAGGSVDLSLVQYVKRPGGNLSESFFVHDGFILPKKPSFSTGSSVVTNAKILVANTHMDVDKIKVYGAKVKATSPQQVAEVERAEREKMRAKVDAIVRSGCNVFVNRQLVYDWPEQLLQDHHVMCIEHADFEGVERVAAAVGARIQGTFDGNSSEGYQLGACERVESVDVFGEEMTKFVGLPATGHAATIVLRGATEVLLDEAERSLHDALRVLSTLFLKGDARTVLGAGHAELMMAANVDCGLGAAISAGTVSGKTALAVEAFARALRALPLAIADNAGLDGTDVVGQLKLLHANAALDNTFSLMGLQIGGSGNGVGDVRQLGVIESYQLKRQVVLAASEAAEMLLRVDYIFREAPKQREEDHCH